MRIFKDFNEAHAEVERELLHNGTVYQTETVQDKTVRDSDQFKTKELVGYSFLVRDPKIHEFIEKMNLSKDWIKDEFLERTSNEGVNPGKAWEHREEIWREFIHNGKFSYTYSERMNEEVDKVIEILRENPSSRHGIISIYNPSIDNDRRGRKMRVPCTMYYMFFNRMVNGFMHTHMIYNIRSNDFATHFPYDLVLARMLQEWVALALETMPGDFIYQSGSLHMFQKDSKEIF